MRRLVHAPGLLALLALVAALGYCRPAHAYAWMIKHGFAKCEACHTDPSGGETLTQMGRAEADLLLSWGGDERTDIRPSAGFLFGLLPEPDDIRLGASYRHLFTYSAAYEGAPSDSASFPMQLDAYGAGRVGSFVFGGSVGVARGIEGTAHVRGAQLNRESGDGFIVLSRTHFVGLALDERTVLRLGRLNLPFGVRVPEHVLWVREATRTDRESDQQHGVALAHSSGPLRFELMVVAGNYQIYPDLYRERGYSASAEYLVAPKTALGISSLITRANEDRFTLAREAVRHAHGLTGRFGLSREVAIWAEADVLKEGGRGWGYTGLAQVDFEPLRGLHLMFTGEGLDQGLLEGGGESSAGNGKPRLGAWATIDWQAFSHLELRFDSVKRQDTPLTLQFQLHVFL